MILSTELKLFCKTRKQSIRKLVLISAESPTERNAFEADV